MLKIFCGYGLEDLETSHELNIHHYMHEYDVIKLCEDFLNELQPFSDEIISVKTNYDLVIETFITCSYEQNQWNQCQIIYRDENQQEHLITLLESGDMSDFPDGFMNGQKTLLLRKLSCFINRSPI